MLARLVRWEYASVSCAWSCVALSMHCGIVRGGVGMSAVLWVGGGGLGSSWEVFGGVGCGCRVCSLMGLVGDL